NGALHLPDGIQDLPDGLRLGADCRAVPGHAHGHAPPALGLAQAMSTAAAAIQTNSLARWRGWRVRPRAVIVFTVLLLGGITMVMPIAFMLSTSLKYAHEVYDLNLIPREPTLDNYLQLFEESAFLRWFLNSLLVATVSTVSVVFFDSLVGYALCKFRFR